MGKPVVFKDLGKSASDLLTKDFKVGQNTVEVKTKTSNGVEFTPKATNKGSEMSGSLVAKYGFGGGISTETTLNTCGQLETTLEAADAIQGCNVKLECVTDKGKASLSSAKLTLEYKQDKFTCKTSYDHFKDSALAANCAIAFGSATLGGSIDLVKAAPKSYAAALQFDQPDFTLMAQLSENIRAGEKTYTGSYFHKISSAMQVGTEINKKGKADIGLAFGCNYKLDKDTTVKGKVDADGILSASYKQKISSLTTLTLAASVNTMQLDDPKKNKFGLALNITP